jgi:N-formylglutamate deformylase
VLDSPHSGTFYPHDFGAVCDLPTLRRAEDTHVEKIYAFAPALGVAWVEAHFPRIYLDANRDTTELDTTLLDGEWTDPISTDPKVLSKVRLGKGLIWKFTDEGEPIYNRLLSVAEVRARIDRCWRPYHAAVAQAIDAAHARHGYSIHINCHSMPAVAASHATEFPGMVHADFVVGDRDGSTASPALSALICEHLRGCGYSVEYNHPYKGVELVRRYGNPAQHRHSIQVEINRKLYMDETTLDWLALEPGNADRQPFPSVWPVRTLRSDVEPANFTARLGLYSMDNGTPLAPAPGRRPRPAPMRRPAPPGCCRRRARRFCATRPPGHHAGADFMGGYCFLNNAAVAAQALRDARVSRVAVLDVDYHHGNGTQSLFYERADVLFVSIHGDPRTEYPFYLGHADETGRGRRRGLQPEPAAARRQLRPTWFEALDAACARIAAAWLRCPGGVAGAGHLRGRSDLAFALQADDFSRLGERLARLGMPTVFVLEGGYAAAELGRTR